LIRAALIAGLTAALPLAGTCVAAPPKPPPATYFACSHRIADLGGHSGALELEKTFGEDGSVRSFSVTLEEWEGSFIRHRSPAERSSVELRWPGNQHVSATSRRFSWAEGSIKINISNDGLHRFQKKERWRQTVVDRNGTVFVHDEQGMRSLFLNGFEMWLMSDMRSLSSPGLEMSVDALLAYGTGVPTLTVYETLLQHRRYRRNVYPNTPIRRLRVVAEYEIDVLALARTVAEVKQAAQSWEAGLGDFKVECERRMDESDDTIVLT
jgi:hypothetical protein